VRYVHGDEDDKKMKKEECPDFTQFPSLMSVDLKAIHNKDDCGKVIASTLSSSSKAKHVKTVHLQSKDILNDKVSDLSGATSTQFRINNCIQCSYSTPNASVLATHIKGVHQKIKDFSCNICNYKCSYKGNLLQHMRSKHASNCVEKKDSQSDDAEPKERSIDIITCFECGFSTSQYFSMTMHMQTVHPEKDIINEKAGWTSGIPSTIFVMKKFECKLCVYSAQSASVLGTHVKAVHQKIKEFSCNLCIYRSAYKGHLLQHMMKHDAKCEEKQCHQEQKERQTDKDKIIGNFDCYFCDFKCSLEGDLVKHMKLMNHSGIQIVSNSSSSNHNADSAEIISCLLCDFKSNRKSKMAMHVQSIHICT
jgi:KRAB domain-containing zinc finger protein